MILICLVNAFSVATFWLRLNPNGKIGIFKAFYWEIIVAHWFYVYDIAIFERLEAIKSNIENCCSFTWDGIQANQAAQQNGFCIGQRQIFIIQESFDWLITHFDKLKIALVVCDTQ